MSNPVFLLWINHGDSFELVGVYSERELAEKDQLKIEPKTFIQQKQFNKGNSIFLESEPIPQGEEEK